MEERERRQACIVACVEVGGGVYISRWVGIIRSNDMGWREKLAWGIFLALGKMPQSLAVGRTHQRNCVHAQKLDTGTSPPPKTKL